ncbi:DUF4294 domain-containing protein [uncultured Bacteroides sp.]|uniref:DUF4294 domain-containing protein n=1 Tax=uncultured Bacteroides sp. TaxID=162156 RepID=UPI002AA5F2D9|nr:DUF4294 domain-containing protein [uncultured Bacteroides sp.]
MKRWLNILIFISIVLLQHSLCKGQENKKNIGFLVPVCVYEGDTIPWIQLRDVYIFKPLNFKNDRERKEYYRLIYNVKKTLPISRKINQTIIETYEYLETLPDEKAKQKHIKRVEKGLKEQYSAQMKKLSFTQGKLLIKLVDRESNQTSYELVKAFMGPFKAGLYQAFAGLFGASLKKQYDAQGEDKLTERVVLLVENGQL